MSRSRTNIEAMLKHARKRMQQRAGKPLAKHARETMTAKDDTALPSELQSYILSGMSAYFDWIANKARARMRLDAPLNDDRAENIHCHISDLLHAALDYTKHGGLKALEAMRVMEYKLRYAVDNLALASCPVAQGDERTAVEAWLLEWRSEDGNAWAEADVHEVRARNKAQQVGATVTPMIRTSLASPQAGSVAEEAVGIVQPTGDTFRLSRPLPAGTKVYAAPQASADRRNVNLPPLPQGPRGGPWGACEMHTYARAAVLADRQLHAGHTLNRDEQRLAVWRAIQAIQIGNLHDDKLIVANLHAAGYVVTRAALSDETAAATNGGAHG